MAKAFSQTAFSRDPAGCYALGQILTATALNIDFDGDHGDDDVGFWQCDLTNHDALTWSDKVYEIFGLPHGSEVRREEAVTRYREHSRGVLERLRTSAINRRCGFILDAAIDLDGFTRWIRILAAPIVENDRVVGLRGLKRILEPERR